MKLLAIFLLANMMLTCGKDQPAAINHLPDQLAPLTTRTITPLGVHVQSDKPLSPAMSQGIDEEFTAFQDIAARHGYTRNLNPATYTIYIFPSVRDNNPDGTYNPVFKVYFNPNDPYDESPYDQELGKPGGWTFASEWVIDLDNSKFVIAENNSVAYTRAAVHNGLDHLILYSNDRPKYEATKSHANGSGHPILQ